MKGVVAKLVHLQDPTTTTALEVAAGGKLYQVCTAGLTFCIGVTSSVAGLSEAEINPVNKCITSEGFCDTLPFTLLSAVLSS